MISVGQIDSSTWSTEARHLCRSGAPGDGEAGRRDAARGQGLSLMGKTVVIFTMKNLSCVKMFIDFYGDFKQTSDLDIFFTRFHQPQMGIESIKQWVTS